jgi:hypothetical protein
MEREGHEVWAKRVARWRDSELTANEFAQEIGVNANTFKHWAWKLGAGVGDKPRGRQRTPRGERSASFIEVAPPTAPAVERDAAAAPETRAASVFELVLGDGRTLRVPPDFDAGALRRLVAALETC